MWTPMPKPMPTPGVVHKLFWTSTRRAKTVDIDCMTPENIRLEQKKDSILNLVRNWKIASKKQAWNDVAQCRLPTLSQE